MIYNLSRAKKKGETWFINDYYSSLADFTASSLNFISNGTNFTSITIKITPIGSTYIKYDDIKVNNITTEYVGEGTVSAVSSWIDQAYRTITLSTPATGELLTWLQSNAVKQ